LPPNINIGNSNAGSNRQYHWERAHPRTGEEENDGGEEENDGDEEENDGDEEATSTSGDRTEYSGGFCLCSR